MPGSSRFSLQKAIRGMVCISLCAIFVSACSALGGSKDTSAENLVPNLPDYTITNTTDIQDAISKVAGGATILSGQPEVTALIAGINTLATCYEKAGAIEGRTFVNKTDPTTAGVLFIVNKNALTNPATLLSCAGSKALGAQSVMIQPCAKTFTLNKDNNQFYVAYAGTNNTMCSAFCSNITGCQ
jgi:hypothetical protein